MEAEILKELKSITGRLDSMDGRLDGIEGRLDVIEKDVKVVKMDVKELKLLSDAAFEDIGRLDRRTTNTERSQIFKS